MSNTYLQEFQIQKKCSSFNDLIIMQDFTAILKFSEMGRKKNGDINK